MVDKVACIFLERGQSSFASSGFGCAVKCEDHISLGVCQFKTIGADFTGVSWRELVDLRAWSGAFQPLIEGAEVARAHTRIRVFKAVNFIAAVGQIAENQIMFGVLSVEEGFQPAVMLHALGYGSANDTDMVSFLERKVGGLCDGGHRH